MASQAHAHHHGPVLFWCGVAVAEIGANQPGPGQLWRPAAYLAAALLVAVGFLTVKAAGRLRSPEARQRLLLAGYLSGALLVAQQSGASTGAPGLVQAGSLLLYAVAAVTALRGHALSRAATRGTLLIATGLDAGALRARLDGGDTVAIYRTDRVTDELRDLAARRRLVLVEGAEHDPRAKERISASGLAREIPDLAERDVVVAGPRPFQRYVGGALTRLAVPRSRVRFTSRLKARPALAPGLPPWAADEEAR
ncbi:hypothetical protein Nocox_34650 [Nonomuraea coxensis DSM 45129]|uniref:Uncharacterized protein n=1 Tax=Nonomuraea coxensis DSM 45129 TaxID=1122611 RepID=A0ABX8U9R6_9ACTN|nr:hypothetical protein [Nonomuraea coxensis]QYC44494.1 hypothetical protein Nocox_34650 [Nonomuraea coxensis DSM 45129]